jgi:hypothetical protein
MEMKISNNIFSNVASNSSNATNYAVKSITIKNNLIVCPDYSPVASMKVYTQRMNPAPSYFIPDYSDNLAFAAAGSDSKWIVADEAFSTDLELEKYIPLLSESPLSVANLTTREFVVAPAYSSYGPQY